MQDLAAAITHALKESHRVRMRAIGAGAVNQMVKACAIARGLVAPQAHDLHIIPGFETIQGQEGDISAVVLVVTTVASE